MGPWQTYATAIPLSWQVEGIDFLTLMTSVTDWLLGT